MINIMSESYLRAGLGCHLGIFFRKIKPVKGATPLEVSFSFSLLYIKPTQLIKYFFADLVFWTSSSLFGVWFSVLWRTLFRWEKILSRQWTDCLRISQKTGLSPLNGYFFLNECLHLPCENAAAGALKYIQARSASAFFRGCYQKCPLAQLGCGTPAQQEQVPISSSMRHSNRLSAAFKYLLPFNGTIQSSCLRKQKSVPAVIKKSL